MRGFRRALRISPEEDADVPLVTAAVMSASNKGTSAKRAMQSKWSIPGIVIQISLALLSGCHDSHDADSGAGGAAGGSSPPPAAVAPAIATQPADQAAIAGQSASFSVTASGTAPLSYQWQRNGVVISGATSSTYTLASTAVADSGAKFTVAVTNSAGSSTSNGATLTVTAPVQTVSAATGGQAQSTDGFLTLTIPPGALTSDATLTISSGPDWVPPHTLPSQFSVVPGTTHLVSAQGGSLDPSKRFKVTVSALGLDALQSSANLTGRLAKRALVKLGTRPQTGSGTTSLENLGLVVDCGDGNPVIIMMPPSNEYGSGTLVGGCASPSAGGNQLFAFSIVTWTGNSQPSAPAGNVIWDNAVSFTRDDSGEVPCLSCDSITRGDTWMGSMVRSIAASSVPYNTSRAITLVSLVDDNGKPLVRLPLPITVTGIVLDGPWNFYVTLGSYTLAGYVAYYAAEYVQGAWQFSQQWETTLTGAAATSNGVSDAADGAVVGTAFALDPHTGDLVGVAGNGGDSATGELTADDIARLKTSADGFVVRFNRDGNLVATTPVVSAQALSYENVALNRQRFKDYILRIDHSGNVYLASTQCCANSQSPQGVSGLTLKKIDNTGALLWEAAVASLDESGDPFGVGAAGEYAGYVGSLAINQNNDAYLTYYRADATPANAGHLHTVKVAADTGTVSTIGDVDPAVDQSHYALPTGDHEDPSYLDANGILYLVVDFLGSPTVARLVALDPSLHVVATSALPDFRFNGGVQVDSSGNIYQQTTSWNGQTDTLIPDLRKVHF